MTNPRKRERFGTQLVSSEVRFAHAHVEESGLRSWPHASSAAAILKNKGSHARAQTEPRRQPDRFVVSSVVLSILSCLTVFA